MFLRKIIFSGLLAVLIGLIAAELSFDFENYVAYAGNIENTANRFSTEPVFSWFLLLVDIFHFRDDFKIKLFLMLSAFFIIYSLIELTNKNKKFSFFRSLIALLFAIPPILFSLVVARQGMASGLVLLSIWLVNKNVQWLRWKVIVLLSLAIMSHNLIGAFGVGLIMIRNIKLREFPFYLILFFPLFYFSLEYLYSSFMSAFYGYLLYVDNMRDTGFIRTIFFVSISAFYLMVAPWRSGGYFANSPARNLFVALILSTVVVTTYLFVATDAIRLSYIISILMIAEVVRRLSFRSDRILRYSSSSV